MLPESNIVAVFVPHGRLAQPQNEEDEAARKRRELRDKLLHEEEVVITQEGEVTEQGKQDPRKPAIVVPEGKLAQQRDEDEAARKRRELREKLLRGEEVVVTQEGEVTEQGKQDPRKPAIVVPEGKLAQQRDEDEAARKRRELREKLLRGEEVVVTQEGEVTEQGKQDPRKPAIVVPEGKLAASFYWYERDPQLLRDEIDAMNQFFPQFRLEKLGDGRMAWTGLLQPKNVRRNARWYLQAVYDNNHPNNSTYGGSVKVYSIEPDLEEWSRKLSQNIPHTLRDSSGHLYLCTARPEDVKVGSVSTSAASCIAWAAKWITAFELWLAGEVTTSQFSGHTF